MKTLVFKIACIVVLGFVLISCGASNKMRAADNDEAGKLIESGYFEFQADWAMPLNANDMNVLADAGLLRVGDSPNRINLLGNPNFLKIEGDTVAAYLPFYGVQQFNVNMNATDQAINFDEEAKNYKVKYKESKGQYIITFNASGNSGGYRITLIVFSNKSANLRVNSANRNFIAYDGEIMALQEAEEH